MIRTFHFSAKSLDFSCFEYEDNSLLFASEKLPSMSVSINTPSVPPFDTHLLAYQLVHTFTFHILVYTLLITLISFYLLYSGEMGMS